MVKYSPYNYKKGNPQMNTCDVHQLDYDLRLATEEAARCLLCFDAPCSKACPADTKPDQFIRAIRFKNIKGAAEIIRNANVCGGSCAIVCPAGKLCEGACLRKEIDRPIQIRKLQQFAVEQEMQNNMSILEKSAVSKTKAVACIGAGPASLACAAKLAQQGYSVEIYEAQAKAGGMLSYGIPASRLSQKVADWDIKTVTDLGVKIHLNTKVGTDISVAELEQKYAAIFVGCGLWRGNKAQLGTPELTGVVSAMEFLPSVRQANNHYPVPADVVVIGAGDTGMDCASTAKQLGAKNVTIICNQDEIPAYHEELELVQKMGITVLRNFQPNQFLGDNAVTGVVACHANDFSEIKLKADLVIWAIGQALDSPELLAGMAVIGNKIETHDYQTTKQKYFAAGDAANGGSTVVQAVHEGKAAAAAIINFLVDEE